MLRNAQQLIADYKAKIAALERKMQKDSRKLLKLPAQYGFKSMDAFIVALRAAASGRPAKPAAAPSIRKKRAVITPEMKQKVKAMIGQDKTGSEIAKALGISLPSVQNIKKALGLVKARK